MYFEYLPVASSTTVGTSSTASMWAAPYINAALVSWPPALPMINTFWPESRFK
jgi:hypothetical protein